jgi:hypothetical protein
MNYAGGQQQTKKRIRVVDVPVSAPADEAERLLNAPFDEGFYLEKTVQTGLPEGIGTRGFFKLRMRGE